MAKTSKRRKIANESPAPKQELSQQVQSRGSARLQTLAACSVAAVVAIFLAVTNSFSAPDNAHHQPPIDTQSPIGTQLPIGTQPPIGTLPKGELQTDVETELLSLSPLVYMLRNVLSPTECSDVIKQAMEGKRIESITLSNTAVKKDDDNNKAYEWRRSTTTWLRKDKEGSSPIVQTLLSRVAAATNVSLSTLQSGNALQVAEYEPGGFYLPHFDSSHLEELEVSPGYMPYEDLGGFVAKGGYPHSARAFTALCYLSNDFEGGQTVFPLANKDGSRQESQPPKELTSAMQNLKNAIALARWEASLPSICAGTAEAGISVPPELGSCLLFYNHFVDANGLVGQLDRLSLHAGCTVRGGKKWIANVWGEVIPSVSVLDDARAAVEDSSGSGRSVPNDL